MPPETAVHPAGKPIAALTERGARLWSDETLTKRIAKGDNLAFSEMYRRFHQPVFRYCRSILGCEHDARDSLQNTMAKAMKVLPGEQRDLNLRAWLFRVARNECLDTLRLRRPVVDVTENEPASDTDVASTASTRERLRRTLADIDQLPERQRSALVMRELNDLSFDEIAGALGTSAAVSRQTVYEARLALQDLEEGRSTPCHDVRTAVSAGDRRVLKGRALRAHLRACNECQAFSSNIEDRSLALRSLVPGLSPVAAASVLGSITGAGGSGGAGALVGLANSVGAIGYGTKAAAVIVAVAGFGAGAAGVAHEVDSRSAPDPPERGSLVRPSSSPAQVGPDGQGRPTGRNLASSMRANPRIGSETRENGPTAPGRLGGEPRQAPGDPKLDAPRSTPTAPGQSPPTGETPPTGTGIGGPLDQPPVKLPDLPSLPGNLPQVDLPPIQPPVEVDLNEVDLNQVLKHPGGKSQK